MRRKTFLAAMLALGCSRLAVAQEAAPAETSYPTLRIGGFTDVNFLKTDQKGVDSTSGFNEGQFVLHFGSMLAPKLTFFGEVSLTARPSSFNPVVERAIVKYDFSDAAKLSFGRYHTPINWWNNAFHHGQWLQTSISRPEMTKFGGKFVPVHFVGGLLEGAAEMAGMNAAYKVGLGNGRGNDPGTAGDAGDSNDNRAWLANLSLRPDALYELEVGGSHYRDRITYAATTSTARTDYREKITSVHVVWHSEMPEIIAEWARSEHSAVDHPGSWSNSAWYVQAGFRLPFAGERWKPYVRHERADIDEGDPAPAELAVYQGSSPILPDHDPVYSGLADFRQSLVGLRWDFTDTLAIKGEYRRTKTGTQKEVNGVHLQICFAF